MNAAQLKTEENPTLVWTLSSMLGVAVLSIYVQTTCPTVPAGDSGELIQIACDLGVAHPPGYPTWTMLAHLFSRLPLGGEAAWRINLSSAVYGAGASTLLAAAVGLWTNCAWTGVIAGSSFAFAPQVWTYAVQGEVFALNNLCSALLLLLLVQYEAKPTVACACAGAASIGVALTNQHTIIFFCAPYAVWALVQGSDILLRPRVFGFLVASGLVGLSPYLYLPLAGGMTAGWGTWGDHSTMGGVLRHILRIEYGTFKLANIEAAVDDEYYLRLNHYFVSLPSQLPPLGLMLTSLGLLYSLTHKFRMQDRNLRLLVVFAYTFYLLTFNYLSNLPASSAFFLQVQMRFWPQAHLIISIWYAVGLRQGLAYVKVVLFGRDEGDTSTHQKVPPSLIASIAVGVASFHASCHYAASDLSSNTIFRDFGIEVLKALPDEPKVLLLTLGDEVINSIRYGHLQLDVRPDVTVLDQNYMAVPGFVKRANASSYYHGVVFPGFKYGSAPYNFLMEQFLNANYNNWSVFVCGGLRKDDASVSYMNDPAANQPATHAYRLWPYGMSMQVLHTSMPINVRKWSSQSYGLLPKLSWPDSPGHGSWEELLAKHHYLAAYLKRPHYMLYYAYEASNLGLPKEARDRFFHATKVYKDEVKIPLNGSQTLPENFFRNMAIANSQLQWHEQLVQRLS